MTIPVAVAQWRVDSDREKAAWTAIAAGADQLYLDFGGAHRGPRLDDPGQLAAALDIAQAIATPALVVNHVNDIGLADPASAQLLAAALDCGLALGVRTLHVPGFRNNSPDSPERLAAARAALSRICERAEGTEVTIAYESGLGSSASVALARAVDHPALRIVLDTGNLIDAGHSPEEFAATVRKAGLLLTAIHVKNPESAPTDAIALLPALIAQDVVGSVLVANNYRINTRLLDSDIVRCRRYHLRQTRTIRFPH